MLTAVIKKLIKREDLTTQECQQALETILSLENPEQIAAFLVLMRAKGEKASEISAFVKQMQKHQRNVHLDFPVMDIVGTGGDQANTANISTTASILAASCGVPILKHGNRAVSSQAGSADVLQALGLTLEKTPEQVADCVKSQGIGFCFAPVFHPLLLSLKPIRNALKVPTFLNLLGPLLNPGQAQFMLLGVFDLQIQSLMADILVQLGVERGMVVHGSGLDELNCLGPCDVIEITGHTQKKYRLDPSELGLPICQLNDLIGGSAAQNALLLEEIISNKPSHLANTAILNAGAAVYIYGKASNILEGMNIVRENIANGHAKQTLERFIHA
ncbi:MAG: anthranilate phosphoribosyltransferase [Legionellales bacterium]|jgi:anthranilate phosphoribosyltransferase